MRRFVQDRFDNGTLKLRLALRAANLGIWDWDLETKSMNYSPRARAIYGFSPDTPITFEMVRDATHPLDYPRTSELARMSLAPKIRAKEPYEYRIVRPHTGEVRWVLAYGEAVFVKTDSVIKAVRYVGTIEDITERKNAEVQLLESQIRQRLAIEAAKMAVWEFDIATERITTSPELNRIFGLPSGHQPSIEELRGLYLEGEQAKVQEAAKTALELGDRHFEAEYRCRRPDGVVRWLLLRAEILFDTAGKMVKVIGILLDIDDRKRVEERLTLLMRELNHRVKNSLSVVQSIASQSFRGRSTPEAFAAFAQRLQALASANDLLLDSEWREFDFRTLVERIIAPYAGSQARFHLLGDPVILPARLNVPLALILHELATNSAKYGALSVDSGHIDIRWSGAPTELLVSWIETGGPMVTVQPNKGFGTKLITQILAIELGQVELKFEPAGLECELRIKIS